MSRSQSSVAGPFPPSRGARPARLTWRAFPGSATLAWGLAAAAGIGFIMLTYIPVLWLAAMSFNSDPLSGIPRALTFDWYRDLLTHTDWLAPLLLSFALACAVGLFSMVVATAVGRTIPHMRRQGGFLLLALLPLFVPGLTMGAALFLFLRSCLGLRLGIWSVFLGHVVWALPFALILIVVVTSRFDHRLLEAAADLGASRRQAFWHVEIPLLRPGIVGAAMFGFMLSFVELLRTLFLRGFSTTLPIYQWAEATSQQTQVAITYSLATIIFAIAVPAIGLFFWFLFVRLERGI
jgi:ABC-type spermidine/putrescine transport system permease subunit II